MAGMARYERLFESLFLGGFDVRRIAWRPVSGSTRLPSHITIASRAKTTCVCMSREFGQRVTVCVGI